MQSNWANSEPSGGSDELCSSLMVQDGKVKLNDSPCNSQDLKKFLCIKRFSGPSGLETLYHYAQPPKCPIDTCSIKGYF